MEHNEQSSSIGTIFTDTEDGCLSIYYVRNSSNVRDSICVTETTTQHLHKHQFTAVFCMMVCNSPSQKSHIYSGNTVNNCNILHHQVAYKICACQCLCRGYHQSFQNHINPSLCLLYDLVFSSVGHMLMIWYPGYPCVVIHQNIGIGET